MCASCPSRLPHRCCLSLSTSIRLQVSSTPNIQMHAYLNMSFSVVAMCLSTSPPMPLSAPSLALYCTTQTPEQPHSSGRRAQIRGAGPRVSTPRLSRSLSVSVRTHRWGRRENRRNAAAAGASRPKIETVLPIYRACACRIAYGALVCLIVKYTAKTSPLFLSWKVHVCAEYLHALDVCAQSSRMYIHARAHMERERGRDPRFFLGENQTKETTPAASEERRRRSYRLR